MIPLKKLHNYEFFFVTLDREGKKDNVELTISTIFIRKIFVVLNFNCKLRIGLMKIYYLFHYSMTMKHQFTGDLAALQKRLWVRLHRPHIVSFKGSTDIAWKL